LPDSHISISLNGETCSLASNSTLVDAIEHANLSGQKIAAAVNGEFVPRSQYGNLQLNEQDSIDIVKPVGGG
jgi:sulfur carrier protein